MERGSDAINQVPLSLSYVYIILVSIWEFVGKNWGFFVGNKNPNLLSNDTVRFIIR